MRLVITYLILCSLIVSFGASSAFALARSVSAAVRFTSPLTFTDVASAFFGNVLAGSGSAVYVLGTDGKVRVEGDDSDFFDDDASSAAGFTIVGSETQSINISTGEYTADGGVTPSDAVCQYGAGIAVACDASALSNASAPTNKGTKLSIGLSISTSGEETGGTVAEPSFVVTIVYS